MLFFSSFKPKKKKKKILIPQTEAVTFSPTAATMCHRWLERKKKQKTKNQLSPVEMQSQTTTVGAQFQTRSNSSQEQKSAEFYTNTRSFPGSAAICNQAICAVLFPREVLTAVWQRVEITAEKTLFQLFRNNNPGGGGRWTETEVTSSRILRLMFPLYYYNSVTTHEDVDFWNGLSRVTWLCLFLRWVVKKEFLSFGLRVWVWTRGPDGPGFVQGDRRSR